MAGATIYVGPIERYPKISGIVTALDPFGDLLAHLDFLAAKDLVTDILVRCHGVKRNDAKLRARKIVPHARLAAIYVRQALEGPPEVAFVSCYYAVLNLVKIYILCSAKHALLATNRLHGVAYDPNIPLRRSLMSEVLTLHTTGALPLFHEVVTGQPIRQKAQILMSAVYPRVSEVGAEWELASGKPTELAMLEWGIDDRSEGRVAWFQAFPLDERRILRVAQLPVLGDHRASAKEPNRFYGKTIYPPDASNAEVIAGGLRRFLLYSSQGGMTRTAIAEVGSTPFEEWSIALAFYHLSSVARYRPEFLEYLRESRYWPLAVAARTHGLYRFLLLFWSFVRQETVQIHSGKE